VPRERIFSKVLSEREKPILKQKPFQDTWLLTSAQIWFLAKVYAAHPIPRFREGILKASTDARCTIPNGGWPKIWPDFVHRRFAPKN